LPSDALPRFEEEQARSFGFFLFFAVLCCGGLFATTSSARSNRAPASGYNSISFLEGSFAMPQPLSRVRPTASIRLAPDSLDGKPELATLITYIFAQWATIEAEVGMLLIRILGATAEPALAMYSVITSQRIQMLALNAAAKSALSTEQFEVFKAVWSVLEAVQQPRNKLAHWIYGRCAELPDAILLADPQSLKQMHTATTLLASGKAKRGEADKAFEVDRKSVFVYRKSDLKRIKRDLTEAREMLVHFRYYLNPIFTTEAEIKKAGDGPGTVSGSFRQLSTLRLFREALSRLRADQKNSPSSPI
jgi:hypothetical protein